MTNLENGQTEPEALVDTTTGTNEGELQNAMVWTVWRDNASTTPAFPGDNIQQAGETVLASGHPTNGTLAVYDSQTGTGALPGGTTGYLGVSWELPIGTTNEVQTDSMTGNISFNVVQSRNNGQFVCGQEQQNAPEYTLVAGTSLTKSWDAEMRHGKLGAQDWELGVGLNTQTAGQFANNISGTDLYSNWQQDTAMPFTLSYVKSTGIASVTIREVTETYTVGSSTPANSKIAIYLGASSGSTDSTTIQNLNLNSTAISGSVVATSGGTNSMNISGFDFSQDFTLTGDAIFHYTGTTASRPGATFTIGQ